MPSPKMMAAKAVLWAILIGSIIIALTLIVMSGNQDRIEVEDVAYIMAIGLDRTPDGRIDMTAQIAVPAHAGGGDGGSGGSMPIMLASAQGQTVMDALRTLTQTSSKDPFWGQARVVVFGEELAREGLAPVLDILSRNYETRRLMWVLATPGTARDILEIRPEMENIPALLLAGLENEAPRHSLAPQTTLHEFLVNMASSAEEPHVAAVKILSNLEPVKQGKAEGGGGQGGGEQGGGTKDQLFLDGCGIFHLDKLVGWLTGMESRGLSWLRGDASAGVISFADQASDIKGSAEVLRSSAQLTADVNPDNVAATVFNVRIRAEGRLTEYFSGPSVSEKSTMDKIDQLVAAHIKFEATSALARLQGEYHADAIGLGELVREHLSNFTWDQIRDNWPTLFSSAKVNIFVDFKLRRHGMTTDRLIPNAER